MREPRLVLLITYYFPPAGGPGVQRVLKFVKYLPEFGWEPVVLTVREGAYPSRDPTLARDLPPGVRVYRTASWDPFAWYARWTGKKPEEAATVGFASAKAPDWREFLARWIRANCFLPDARVGWVPFALWAGVRLLRRLPIRALVSSGPPHSVHLIGRALHRRFRIPWVADFRDPWTGIDYYAELPMTGLTRRLDAYLERSVLQTASAVVTVGSFMARALRERLERPYVVIPNGFDEADFASDPPPPDSGDVFRLLHVGTLNAARNPESLWRALEALASEDMRLEVELVGIVDASIRERLRRSGLSGRVRISPYLPHEAALQRMRTADALLLVINRVPGAEGIITGKLYEYIASARPVLGIGPPEGEAAQILRQSGAGQMFDWDDVEGLKRQLRALYAAWSAGQPQAGATPEAARRYSRRALTQELAALLDKLVEEGSCAS
ncbi:MAG: glycosyltransferase family 4 protein [Bacteroidetes bacterium]|nr:glycosyltransferase family 4 protein [Rhodothermia bacterium]MCS7155195.1 glycosyltransferase family 4 protein [Bacteroidota bacterium]MCX7906177.1 glycosyltransferase family 4 protein [Bacteroidota bacterium]MDW8138305.1 glycosyltransferase family 4 protein [Bacteroidota bacterium]MDW8285989.1 glycosyltransferase family 4 protein [Bacteroidota bacterium]